MLGGDQTGSLRQMLLPFEATFEAADEAQSQKGKANPKPRCRPEVPGRHQQKRKVEGAQDHRETDEVDIEKERSEGRHDVTRLCR